MEDAHFYYCLASKKKKSFSDDQLKQELSRVESDIKEASGRGFFEIQLKYNLCTTTISILEEKHFKCFNKTCFGFLCICWEQPL